MTLIILLIIAMIALWRIPKLVKAKRWKRLAMFCVALAAVCGLSLVLASQIKIANPRKAVEDVLDTLEHHGQ